MIIAFVLASISCQAMAGGGSTTSSDPADSKILYSDDFSNTNSGWDEFSDEQSFVGYYLNAYKIAITGQTNYYLWANPKSSLNLGADVRIQVEASLESGSEMNDIGIICRYQDEENFYFMTIGSDGFYGVSKIVKGDESLVGMTEFGKSDAIKSGNTSNTIQASCIGSEIVLSVNGTELARVTDTDLTSGTVGLLVGTYDEGDVSILFDNFKVTAP